MPQGQRHHPRRYAMGLRVELRRTPQVADHRRSSLLAVQQQRRVFAAAAGIGCQHSLDPYALLAGARIGKAQGAARAHRGAAAAAHAQAGVDLDLLTRAVAADRRRRADVNAGIAADLLVAAVCAKLLLVDEEFWLFKLADKAAQLHQGPGVAAVPTQVALRQSVLAERRRWTQIQHQVKSFAERLDGSAEVDRPGRLADRDAGAVRLA